MAEIGCLKDGHFQNLEVESVITNSNDRVQIGDFYLGKAIIHKTVKGTFDATIRNTLNFSAATSDATPDLALLTLREHLATLTPLTGTSCSMSPTDATKLGFVTPTQTTGWVNDMVDVDTVTVINNSDSPPSGHASVLNATNTVSLGDTAGQQALLLFGEDFKLEGGGSLTMTVGNDKVLKVEDGSELMVNSNPGEYTKSGHFTRGEDAGENSTKINLINSESVIATIKKGSFIYLFSEKTGDGKYTVKAVILSEDSSVTLSITEN